MPGEQRRSHRLYARLTTRITFPATGRSESVLTKDISGVGVRLLTNAPIEPGTPLEVEMAHPDRAQPIRFAVEVVWSKPAIGSSGGDDEPKAETGTKFVSIDPKDKALLQQFSAIYRIE